MIPARTLLAAGCVLAFLAAALARPPASAAAKADVTVHVVSNGWHTGIVVARADLPPGAVPEAADFPLAPYLEFGWGDAEYFPDSDAGLAAALGAALGPTPAVVHLVGLPGPPSQVFPKAETVDLRLTAAGFRRLVRYLDAAFERGGAPRAPAAAPGIYPFSRFYPATGAFHLFNTCNTWTARGLAEAGLAIDPAGVIRAEDLMAELREGVPHR